MKIGKLGTVGISLICVLSTPFAFGASVTWTGGGGAGSPFWTSGANWSSGSQPVSGSDSIVFPSGVAHFSVTMAPNFTASGGATSLTFGPGAPSYTVSSQVGTAITFTNPNGITINSGATDTYTLSTPLILTNAIPLTQNADSPSHLILNGALTPTNSNSGILFAGSGSGMVSLNSVLGSNGNIATNNTGGGVLVINEAQTYSGMTQCTSGVIRAGGDNVFSPNSDVSLISGAVIDLNGTTNTLKNISGGGGSITLSSDTGGTLTLLQSGSSSFGGIISDGGSGAGNLIISGGSLALGGASTYSGPTTVNNATVSLSNNQSLGMGSSLALSGTLQASAPLTLTKNITLETNSTIDTSSFNTTLSGVVSGTQTLTKRGTGTLTLNNSNNNATGWGLAINQGSISIDNANKIGAGALSFDGGTLLATGDLTLNQATTLNAGGGTVNPNGHSVTFSGNLEGTGSLAQIGVGTLIFNTSHSYSGGTTVSSGGTLQVNDASYLPQAIGVINNGDLIFNQTGIANYGGAISGFGTLIKSGPGTLILPVANTYAGGTYIEAMGGTLSVGHRESLGFGSVAMGTSTTLQAAASIHLINDIDINGANTKIDTNGFDLTLSGMIIGNEDLTKSGAGTLTLLGDAYVNDTHIQAGTLFIHSPSSLNSSLTTISAGAALGGMGGNVGSVTVSHGGMLKGDLSLTGTVTNHGQISPGNSIGTISIVGHYIQGSSGTYYTEINANEGPGNTDLIEVTGSPGTADIAGALHVTPSPGVYIPGTEYTILTATGGVNGQFNNLIISNPNLVAKNFSLQSLPNSVLLTFIGGDGGESGAIPIVLFRGSAGSGNSQSVLSHLTSNIASGNPDLINIVNTLANLGDPTSALNQLQPSLFGAFDLLNINTMSYVASIFNHRSSKISSVNLTDCCAIPENVNIWLEPFGYWMDQGDMDGQVGFKADTLGVLAGADYKFCNGIVLGFGGGYNHEHIDWKENRGKGNIQSGQIGIYSDWIKKRFYLESAIVGGINSYDASRNIDFAHMQRVAKHDSKGYSLNVHLGSGVSIYQTKRFFYFQPFANLDYIFLNQPGFTEQGAGSLDLHVKGRYTNMLRSELGLNYSRVFRIGDRGCFAPKVWVSAVNEAYIKTSNYRSSFSILDSEFVVSTYNEPITLFSPGGELSFSFDEGFSLALRYSAEINHQLTTQKADARLGWNF